MKKRIQIKTLAALDKAVEQKKAVVGTAIYFRKPVPAAFVINMNGAIILRLIKHGLFIYQKEATK